MRHFEITKSNENVEIEVFVIVCQIVGYQMEPCNLYLCQCLTGFATHCEAHFLMLSCWYVNKLLNINVYKRITSSVFD